MPSQQSRGLPPRIYLPVLALLVLLFLVPMAYLVADGFGVTGSVFGKAAKPGAVAGMQADSGGGQQQGSQGNVEGGPPAAVVAQLKTLRDRIAAHPNDDVAITQLADMYLAANKFADAIPLYKRALTVNPKNVAAQTGLAQSQEGLRDSGGSTP